MTHTSYHLWMSPQPTPTPYRSLLQRQHAERTQDAFMKFGEALDRFRMKEENGGFITRQANALRAPFFTPGSEGASEEAPLIELAIMNALVRRADHLHTMNRPANVAFLPAAFTEIAATLERWHEAAAQAPALQRGRDIIFREMAPFFARLNNLKDPLTSAINADDYGEDMPQKAAAVLTFVPRHVWDTRPPLNPVHSGQAPLPA